MLWRGWRRTIGTVPRSTSVIVAIALSSLVGGLAGSAVLVAVVLVATDLGNGRRDTLTGLPGVADADVGTVLVVAVSAVVLMVISHIVTERLTVGLARASLLHVQRRLVRAYLDADPERRRGLASTYLSDGVTGLATETVAVATGFGSLLGSMLTVIPVLAVAAAVDPLTTAIVLVGGGALVATTAPLTRRIRSRTRSRILRREALVEATTRWTRLRDQVRLFDVEVPVTSDLERDAGRSADALAAARMAQRMLAVGRTDVVLVLVVVALAVLYAVRPEAVTAIGATVLLLVRALQSAQSVQRSAQDLHVVLPAAERAFERVDELDAMRRPNGDVRLADLVSVGVDDVGYRYPATDRAAAVHGVSFDVRRGEIVAIVGPSGGGKTTIVQMLLRLARPTEGRVTVVGEGADGAVDIDRIVDADWARLVSGVPQDPDLLDGTVADNIAFLRPGVSRSEIVESARRAHLHDEIEALPQGYDTALGAGGSGLSGGQRQRIGIARALVGGPRLLVLDEPTSALDATSEERIRDTLLELRATTAIVVVAHRPSLVEIADRVITVDGGRIVSVHDRTEPAR